MNRVGGVEVQAGCGLLAFRLQLWRGYLGLASDGSEDKETKIADPIAAFALWRTMAHTNRELLSSAYSRIPRPTAVVACSPTLPCHFSRCVRGWF